MIIKNDELLTNKYQFKHKGVINKYSFDGNTSVKINPFPFIVVDISTKADKKEGWNSNWSFALNRRELFIMICKLTNLYNKFKSIQNLFYEDSYTGETVVNKELSELNKEVFIASNKRISVQACIVDEQTASSNIKYEGVVLYVNNYEFYSYLTYAELEYLLYELRKIDLNKLMMDAINSYLLTEKMESDELKLNHKEPIQQEKEEEIIDTKPSIYIEDAKVIPDI